MKSFSAGSSSTTTTTILNDKQPGTRLISRPLNKKQDIKDKKEDEEPLGYKSAKFAPLEIIWPLAIGYVVLHVAAFWGLYLAATEAKWTTLGWGLAVMLFGAFGITGGAHRLWCHRSYKAKWPLRLLAAAAQTVSLTGSLVRWSRFHRVHHRYTESDADPNDSRRGFFFAHAGWFLCKEHPDVTKAKAAMDISDVLNDPIALYQHKFYIPLVLLLSIWIPSAVPWYCWGESLLTAFLVAFVARFTLEINMASLVNSLAHTYSWGTHPYDKYTSPTENVVVSLLTVGEGWHNYHHAFPWDYKAGELGQYGTNWTTAVIDFFASIGWAYDLKTTSDKVIRSRVLRTGDGSHNYSIQEKSNGIHKGFKEEDDDDASYY